MATDNVEVIVKMLKWSFRVLLLAVLIHAAPSGATSVTTDQSDLWWNANEPGWGIQMVQRDQAIFATIYIYSTGNTPTWYTALMNYQGNFVWTGDLYLSNGSWFGAVPYNPAAFLTQKVGTMTWNAPNIGSGTLSYSVNGVQVVKNLVRFQLAVDNFSGTYPAMAHLTTTGCTDPTQNGVSEGPVVLTVAQNGASFQMGLGEGTTVGCTVTGSLNQTGQFGSVNGQWTCTDGTMGSFNLAEMTVGANSISLRFSDTDTVSKCSDVGYMSGIRSRPN